MENGGSYERSSRDQTGEALQPDALRAATFKLPQIAQMERIIGGE